MVTSIQINFKRIFKLFKWFFTLLAYFFLFVAIWKSRLIIRDTFEQSLAVYFIFAVLAWIVAQLLSPLFVRIVLTACGAKLRYEQLLDLHIRYLPARYIPGGIWHTAARVAGLRRLGVLSSHLSIFIILENLIALSITITVGGGLVGIYQTGSGWQSIAFLSAAISLFVLVVCPIILKQLILKTNSSIWYRNYLNGVIISIIFWSFASMSFLLFIFALPNNFINSDVLEIVGVYLFSWGIGFIAIFAPQGIGVFEVVAANIMPIDMPFSALVALLAGFRLVVIIADFVMWIGWGTWFFIKKAFQA